MYQIWPQEGGKSRFLCRGRCITGPAIDWLHNSIAWSCILVPSGLYFLFCSPYLWREVHPLMPVFTGILLLIVIVFMLLVGCTDPGIIPRHTVQMLVKDLAEDVVEVTDMPRPVIDEANSEAKNPLSQDDLESGRKWCDTCKVVRPPGAHHCRDCDQCVMGWDHHCPFVGNCVGQRNYPFFLGFLWSVLLLAVAVLTGAGLYVSESMGAGHLHLDSSLRVIVVIVFGAVTVVMALAMLGFVCFHIYLVCSGRRTAEVLRGRDRSGAPNSLLRRNRSLMQGRQRVSFPYPV